MGSLVSPAGPESIWVSGGAVSTVKLREAGVGSVLAAPSVARTSKLCGAVSERAGGGGELQAE